MRGFIKFISLTLAVVLLISSAVVAQASAKQSSNETEAVETSSAVNTEKSKATAKELYFELRNNPLVNESEMFRDYPLDTPDSYDYYTLKYKDAFRDMLLYAKSKLKTAPNDKKSKAKTGAGSKKSTKGNTTYSISGTTLYINGSGDMDNYGYYDNTNHQTPWYSSRNNIEKIVIENGITSIGSYSFEFFDNLTEVSLPESLKTIGENAFDYCEKLTSVTLPYNLEEIKREAFNNTGLTNIIFPNSVKAIGAYAFARTSLSSVNIPDSVERLERNAFQSEALQYVHIGSGVEVIDGNPFGRCVSLTSFDLSSDSKFTIKDDCIMDGTKLIAYPMGKIRDSYTVPSYVTEIGDYAFYSDNAPRGSNYTINNLTIPGTIKRIGDSAFTYCNISNLTLENGVEEISDDAFMFNKFTSVNLPDSLTRIGTYAFSGCFYLTGVTIPKNVKSIGYGILEANYDMGAINVASDNPYFKSIDGVLYSKDGKILHQYPDGKSNTTFYMPDTVERIDIHAFFQNSNLANVNFSSNLKYIDYGNFDDHTSITQITLPDSIVELRGTSFLFNDNLKKVIVGKNLAKIEAAFVFGENTKDIYFLGNLPQDYYTMLSDSASYNVFYPQDDSTWKNGNITLQNTNISLRPWDSSTHYRTDISPASVTLSKTSYTYDGTIKQPDVSVSFGGKTLMEGIDYECTYSNNINAGTATAKIEGIGDFYGTINKSYTINKADQVLSASINAYSVKVGNTAQINASGKGTISYSSSNDSIASVDRYGEVTGVRSGSARITVSASGDNNYKSDEKTLNITVTGEAKILTREDLNYNFGNSPESFGYPVNYKIPYERYLMFFSPEQASVKYNNSNYWGGSCAGFSGTSILFYDSMSSLDINDFNSSADRIYDLSVSDYSSKYGINIRQLLESFQVGQSQSPVSTANSRNWNDIRGLVNEVKKCDNGGKPLLVGIYRGKSSDAIVGGHAIVGYKYEYVDSTTDKIYVYDCNMPYEDNYIELYKSNGTYTGFSYSNSRTYTAAITYVLCSDYAKLWDNRNKSSTNYNDMLMVNSDTFDILSADGEKVAEMKEGKFTSYNDGVYENYECDSQSTSHNIIVPTDRYKIINKDNSVKTFSVAAANTFNSASVKTQSDEVEFFVDDSQNSNIVTVNGNEGEDYKITLNSDTDYTKDNSEVEFKGESNGKETTVGTAYGEYINDNYTQNGIKVDDVAVNVDNYAGLNLSSCSVELNKTSYSYSGAPVLPNIKITNAYGNILSENTDYTVVAASNVDPGTATAEIYGINGYKGKLSVSYKITEGNISDCDISLDKNKFVYTGSEIKPEVIVSASGTVLSEGEHYTLTYYNNVNIGTGYVIVSGKGKFSGSKTLSFSIENEIVEPTTQPPTQPATMGSKLDIKGLTCTASTSDSLSFSWDSVEGTYPKYYIQYKTSSSDWIDSDMQYTNYTTIKNLSPSTYYSVRVRAFVSGVIGSYSSPVSAWTKAQSTPTPTQPATQPATAKPAPTQPSSTPSRTYDTEVEFYWTSDTLYRKESSTYGLWLYDEKGKTTFTSSNSSVASVTRLSNDSVKVKAKKAGIATITAKNNGVKSYLRIKVINPKLNKKSKTLKRGKTFKLSIIGRIGKATFKSSNKKVATVTKKGKIKAKKKGKSTITVKTNGIKLKCKIKVK